MKLLWYLGDWWLWTFFLFALLVMPVMAEGTWSALPVIASLGLVLSLKPDFQKYQLVGLGNAENGISGSGTGVDKHAFP